MAEGGNSGGRLAEKKEKITETQEGISAQLVNQHTELIHEPDQTLGTGAALQAGAPPASDPSVACATLQSCLFRLHSRCPEWVV